MDISKNFLRQYLFVVAVNQDLMNKDVADALLRYDRKTFVDLIEARIRHLKAESTSATAFFTPDFYDSGVNTMIEALDNLDHILSAAD